MGEIKSFRTKGFKKLFSSIPPEIKKQAQKNYKLWLKNPYHPSLNFKLINKERSVYSSRIGLNWRVLGVFNKNENEIVWFWIGSHEDYSKLINR